MNVLVLVKHVYDESQLKVDRVSGRVGFEGVPGKMSDFDRHAIEASLVIRATVGGKVTALTFGRAEAVKSLREALAMGVDRAVLIREENFEMLDVKATADVIRAACDKLGPFDLFLCAEGSVDVYSSLLAPVLSEKLGLPLVSYAQSLVVKDNAVVAERALERKLEMVEVALPAVISVTGEVNSPRIPTLLQIMAAMKKEIVTFTLQDLGLNIEKLKSAGFAVTGYSGKSKERRKVIFEGTPSETATKLLEILNREGLLS